MVDPCQGGPDIQLRAAGLAHTFPRGAAGSDLCEGPCPWATEPHSTGGSPWLCASWGSHCGLQDAAGSPFAASELSCSSDMHCPHGSSPRTTLFHFRSRFWAPSSLDSPCAERNVITLGGPHQSRQGSHLPGSDSCRDLKEVERRKRELLT